MYIVFGDTYYKLQTRIVFWFWLFTCQSTAMVMSGRSAHLTTLFPGQACREWKLTTVDPQERSTWRSGVRSAMRAASQLPGKGPTDVDDAPAPAR